MKVLHFHAVAEHTSVRLPLMGQTAETLWPFRRFLKQAIHAAKDRQARYQLPWALVRDLRLLSLDPMDTRLIVPRRQPAWFIPDWPADKAADLDQPLMIVSRGVMVRALDATRLPSGLRFTPDSTLHESDQVFWCGQPCTLQREREVGAPQSVSTLSGRPLCLLRPPLPQGEDHWRLVVEGLLDAGPLLVDGEEVEADTLPPMEGVGVLTDASGRALTPSGGTLKVQDLPADGPLTAQDGARYAWREHGGGGRQGIWVQLLLPESEIDADAVIDPRAAFCEDDISEVWTQPRHNRDAVYPVLKVDRDRYQIQLKRLPPPESRLHLPVDVRNLQLQQRALRQLADAPLPHHRGLLRLCEKPAEARWPAVRPASITDWHFLRDVARDGTDEQRAFVERALATPDLALLEGPPGSGKTTAICELIWQLVARGQRVLVCASTHVAIDNVLERLMDAEAPIEAVRVGQVDRVDPKVAACQIDQRVDALLLAWRGRPGFSGLGDGELREMAQRTLLMAANLTAGTTMGIVNHPVFRDRDQDLHPAERPICTTPLWDVLIVDEASKTLVSELLVPGLLARRHVIVGDIRQLPPFSDRQDLVVNLRALVNERENEILNIDHQRALLLRSWLGRPDLRGPGLRWLLVERAATLVALRTEIAAEENPPTWDIAMVVPRKSKTTPVREVTPDELAQGTAAALGLAGATWVCVPEDLLAEVAHFMPANLLLSRDIPESLLPMEHPFRFRQARWLARTPPLVQPVRERGREHETAGKAQSFVQGWLSGHDWAGEVAWRLTRTHELKSSKQDRERKRLTQQIDELLPLTVNIEEQVSNIEEIGLPSILEVIQEGIGSHHSRRPSALNEGLARGQPEAWAQRFTRLRWQHRMHPEISAFSREIFYHNEALLDANTIASRDQTVGWSAPLLLPARRVWVDIRGNETRGENLDEVRLMRDLLARFLRALRERPPGRDRPRVWEIACLSFYVKQERAIRTMLQQLTGDDRQTRFSAPHVEIVCATVDRFQGREADLVLLSLRNTRRVGFLDSPNRLNVALTRARQQLFVVGNADYFGRCGVSELSELTRRTRVMTPAALLGGAR